MTSFFMILRDLALLLSKANYYSVRDNIAIGIRRIQMVTELVPVHIYGVWGLSEDCCLGEYISVGL